MELLKKSDVKPVTLIEEVVPVPELGGSVIVRSAGLSERMTLSFSPQNGKKDFAHMANLLAVCVLDGDHEPLFSPAEWEAFGSKHLAAACGLWDAAWRLSDFNGDQAAKNEKAPNSD
ncbi:hypothetical protein ACHMW6_06440 [Pseudoduganella sp. UC29_106]|uniref:hypothetical protein n=1 Tax=Pseudoduganella sp. UC29_106 TaxID=3374553 RepID=UPI003757A609